MAKFLVMVEGRLIVEAADKAGAKIIVAGILTAKQPWLSVSYNDPTSVAEAQVDVTDDLIVAQG